MNESDGLRIQIGLLLLGAAVLLGVAFSMLSGSALLRRLEPLGAPIWSVLRPLALRSFPPRHAGAALLTGLAWGWIPCAMVYAALPLALVAGSVGKGAAVMLAFGLGTIPNMAAFELAAGRVRRAMAGGCCWPSPAGGGAVAVLCTSARG